MSAFLMYGLVLAILSPAAFALLTRRWVFLLGYLMFLVTLVLTAFFALFLHPAKGFILPGMGFTDGTWKTFLVLTAVPWVLGLVLVAYILMPGRAGGRRRYGGILVVLSAVLLTGYQGFLKSQGGGWQMPPATIVAQTVTTRNFDDRIEAVGTTEANESTALTSNVSETVKEIFFTEGAFVTAGTVLVRLHDDEEQAGLIEAQRAFERSAKLVQTSAVSAARLDADRARLDIVRAQIRDRQITAPFDGILGLRSISVGDIVNSGTVITTLDDVDPIKLEFSVPESFMAAITPGQNVEARAEAYRGQIFTGTVRAIDPRIDPITRALRIKAEVPNPQGKLRAGMLMTVDVVSNPRRNPAISEEAITSQREQKFVRVLAAVDADGFAEVTEREVKIGARRPGYVEITTGLKEGDKIVVDGVIKAAPGSKVKIGSEKNIDATVARAVANAVPGKQADLEAMGIAAPEPTPADSGVASPSSAP